MKNFIRSIFSLPYLIMAGMYAAALLGILLPKFAEWPLVPVMFLSLIPTFAGHVDRPRWDLFAAATLGALSVQVLFWVA